MITPNNQEQEQYLLQDQDQRECREQEVDEIPQFPRLFFRVIVIGLITWGLLTNAINGWGLPVKPVDCVQNSLFQLTDNATKVILTLQGGLLKTITQIICSLSCDGLFLISGILWVKQSKSNRFIYALVSVYLTKVFFSLLFKLQTPMGYTWSDSGFPSITISYNNDNNFFFSATIGMLTVLTREFCKINQICLMLYSMFIIVLLSCLFTILKAHYVIDILYGVMIGDFYFSVFNYYCSQKHSFKNPNEKEENLQSTTTNESYYVKF